MNRPLFDRCVGKYIIHRAGLPDSLRDGKWHYSWEDRVVKLMAISGNYAMVRRKGRMPYVAPLKELRSNYKLREVGPQGLPLEHGKNLGDRIDQLEREISDMTAARDRTVRLLDEAIEENTKLRGEIAEAIERIADLRSGVDEANQRWLAARSAKTPPLDPTPAMVEAGAQRLVRWETGNEKWPDAWSKLDVRAARNDAERCWRSMWLEAEAAAQPTEKAPTEGGTVGGTASLTVLTETAAPGEPAGWSGPFNACNFRGYCHSLKAQLAEEAPKFENIRKVMLKLISFAEDAASGFIEGSGSDEKWQRDRDATCKEARELLTDGPSKP